MNVSELRKNYNKPRQHYNETRIKLKLLMLKERQERALKYVSKSTIEEVERIGQLLNEQLLQNATEVEGKKINE